MSLYTTTILSGVLLLAVFAVVSWWQRRKRTRAEREEGRSVGVLRDRR